MMIKQNIMQIGKCRRNGTEKLKNNYYYMNYILIESVYKTLFKFVIIIQICSTFQIIQNPPSFLIILAKLIKEHFMIEQLNYQKCSHQKYSRKGLHWLQFNFHCYLYFQEFVQKQYYYEKDQGKFTDQTYQVKVVY